jgi:hypothetical protein
MERLVARYTIQLDECLVVKRARDNYPTYTALIDDFEVSITLSNEFTDGILSGAERLMTCNCHEIEVTVSRKETEAPPRQATPESGGTEYNAWVNYFLPRTQRYAENASEALRRLFLYFRYRLRQPLLESISPTSRYLANPTWLDETGAVAGYSAKVWVAGDFPREFGVIPLQAEHDQRVCRALSRRLVPSLHAELLADAQAAALRGNVRRAVFELAVACEVAIKAKFYGRGVGGRTLEHLEQKRQLNVVTIDLIAKPAEHIFGQNFMTSHRASYDDLDQLVKCRNEVAHRGRPIIRDSRGLERMANAADLERWLCSARELFVWLKKLRQR